jgi:hypothetical protein
MSSGSFQEQAVVAKTPAGPSCARQDNQDDEPSSYTTRSEHIFVRQRSSVETIGRMLKV